MIIAGMKCSACGLPMKDNNEVIGFPAFIANQRDPLYQFNDGVFHVHCLKSHALAETLFQRYEAWTAANLPKSRICRASGQLISDPEDYIGLGFLVESPVHELFPYNFAHFSQRALREWNFRDRLVMALTRLAKSSE